MVGIVGFSRDGVGYIVVVALAVCLVCSVLVASAATFLKPLQTVNAKADRRSNILDVAGLPTGPDVDVNQVFKDRIETKVVDLSTGGYAQGVDVANYDQRAAASDPKKSIKIPPRQDIADIKRRAKYAEVYLVRDEQGKLSRIVLPIHGYGLWSTMYGFLALEPDANTVDGIKYYEQGETPGLGGEVENPRWRAKWDGKKVYGEDGDVRLSVIKGSVGSNTPNADYKVDGLSGATLTSRGVSNMIHYWLGESGFEPFLKNIRSGKVAAEG
ncbi:Na(+)-translocating NADH-quinone reductase subunit C [Salinisphaera aquimarina]|uniref:Na(+)-translocating NADH-quinone reductase subunit C n=1 Tax=Salinisphaera aquimarina TaxID=2094031 RepID=A0ABV7EV82_9GAMM